MSVSFVVELFESESSFKAVPHDLSSRIFLFAFSKRPALLHKIESGLIFVGICFSIKLFHLQHLDNVRAVDLASLDEFLFEFVFGPSLTDAQPFERGFFVD